jgi:hypothetical protein
VDARAGEIAALHGARLQCKRGCSGCCVDDLTVFAVEAERIRMHHAQLLGVGAPHPEGACAFLDADGACRIYADRPYVCRTQGLPLRWIDTEREAELRDVCPLNEPGERGRRQRFSNSARSATRSRPPSGLGCPLNEPGDPALEALPEGACFTLGEVEARLAELQREFGAPGERVALRALFENR